MTVTLDEVRKRLSVFEFDYQRMPMLDLEALPHLETLARGQDVTLAAKAIYVAALIGAARSERAANLVAAAADSPVVHIRIAAAIASKHLAPDRSSEIITKLLDDSDVGVRQKALVSVPASPGPQLRARLQTMRFNEPEPALRTMARDILRRAPPP